MQWKRQATGGTQTQVIRSLKILFPLCQALTVGMGMLHMQFTPAAYLQQQLRGFTWWLMGTLSWSILLEWGINVPAINTGIRGNTLGMQEGEGSVWLPGCLQPLPGNCRHLTQTGAKPLKMSFKFYQNRCFSHCDTHKGKRSRNMCTSGPGLPWAVRWGTLRWTLVTGINPPGSVISNLLLPLQSVRPTYWKSLRATYLNLPLS